VELANESVIVTRSAEGALRAFFNVCRHRGTRMCTAAKARSPAASSARTTAGPTGSTERLLGAPHMEQPGFSRADYPLKSVALDTWEGHIFLNFATAAAPRRNSGDLPERFAAWRMAELRLHRRIVYDVKANWKLIVANYNECLHCPLVHPTLNRLTDYLGADNEPPSPDYIGGAMGFRGGAETMSFGGIRRRAYLPGLSEEQRKIVNYYAIYPNLLLALHPDYMMVHTLWPKAVDRTEIVCEWHFHPDEMAKSDFEGDDAVEFWDQAESRRLGASPSSRSWASPRAPTRPARTRAARNCCTPSTASPRSELSQRVVSWQECAQDRHVQVFGRAGDCRRVFRLAPCRRPATRKCLGCSQRNQTCSRRGSGLRERLFPVVLRLSRYRPLPSDRRLLLQRTREFLFRLPDLPHRALPFLRPDDHRAHVPDVGWHAQGRHPRAGREIHHRRVRRRRRRHGRIGARLYRPAGDAASDDPRWKEFRDQTVYACYDRSPALSAKQKQAQ
jgi:glycine betaine catabolism A